jgi:cation diffusion facilitator family transporter
MQEGSRRAVLAAFAANVGIALSKYVAYVFTGSASMLAEAIHSTADTANQALLMLGASRAMRPPDEHHPFGYARVRYFWSFVVALVLFTVGGLFAIYEGIDKLRHVHTVESPGWAIAVLLVSVVLESFSFRTAYRAARPGPAIVGYVRRTKDPELPVVLLEDSGALIGLVFALAGVLLAWMTDNSRWDALGSLAIGVLLVLIAGLLAREMASLLIGESATPEDVAQIRAAIEASPSVRRIIHLRTVHLGPEDVLVATKIEFDPSLTVAELAARIDGVEAEVRNALPDVRLIFIEPDLYRSASDTRGGDGGPGADVNPR